MPEVVPTNTVYADLLAQPVEGVREPRRVAWSAVATVDDVALSYHASPRNKRRSVCSFRHCLSAAMVTAGRTIERRERSVLGSIDRSSPAA
jgi:hypothetical protein